MNRTTHIIPSAVVMAEGMILALSMDPSVWRRFAGRSWPTAMRPALPEEGRQHPTSRHHPPLQESLCPDRLEAVPTASLRAITPRLTPGPDVPYWGACSHSPSRRRFAEDGQQRSWSRCNRGAVVAAGRCSMDPVRFDRLAKFVAHRPSRRAVLGRGLAALVGTGAAVAAGGVGEAKPPAPKSPQGPLCLEGAQLCSHSDECCPSTTGRVCGQNGCAHPDRPRCCAGVGGGVPPEL